MKNIDEIRPLLEVIAHGIAEQFGSDCEVVIHDHSKGLDKSIVYIENNHVTGRVVGGPSSSIGFEIKRNNSQWQNQFGYLTKLNNGKTLRSSSIYFKDDDGKVIGSLCINLDISNMLNMQQSFEFLTKPKHSDEVPEIFVTNVDEIVDRLIKEFMADKPYDLEHIKKKEAIELVSFLDQRGAFQIRNSVEKLCALLHVSRVTMYDYIKIANSKTKSLQDASADAE